MGGTRYQGLEVGMMPQQRGTSWRAGWGAIAVTAGALVIAGGSGSGPSGGTGAASGSTSSAGAGPSAGAGATASGSGGGGGSLTAAQAVRQAAAQAQKATSYSADGSVQTTGAGSPSLSGTMQQQTAPPPLAVADFGSVTVSGQPVSGGIDEIINSNGIYVKMSTLAKETGKPWLEIPGAEPSKVSGANFS